MKNQVSYKLAAALTAGMMVGASDAFAGQTFSNVTSNIVTSSGTLPNLISTVAYIGGIGLSVAGIFKLKQHVDNPGQTPMKDGLVRLGAGGGLLALPMVLESASNTIGVGSAPDPTTLQFGAAAFQ